MGFRRKCELRETRGHLKGSPFMNRIIAPMLCLVALTGLGVSAHAQTCNANDIPDDNSFEDGYLLSVETSTFVQKFTPPSYPYTYEALCVCWRSDTETEVSFDLLAFDDDGTDGQPGTELYRAAKGQAFIDSDGAIDQHGFASNAVVVTEGSIYLGVKWNTPIFATDMFLCADTSPETPQQEGYLSTTNGASWFPIKPNFPDYQSLGLRAKGSVLATPVISVNRQQVGIICGSAPKSAEIIEDLPGLFTTGAQPKPVKSRQAESMEYAQELEPNPAVIESLGRWPGPKRLIGMPLPEGGTMNLIVEPQPVLGPGAAIVANNGFEETPIEIPAVAVYSGYVEGDPESLVMVSVEDGASLHAFVERPGKEPVIYEPLSGGKYWMAQPKQGVMQRSKCRGARHDAGEVPSNMLRALDEARSHQKNLGDEQMLELEVYVDLDFDMYTTAFASDDAAAARYVIDVMAAVSAIYRRDLDVHITLTGATVWTTADPFNVGLEGSQDPISDLLDNYIAEGNTNRTGIQRDVFHLFTTIGFFGEGIAEFKGLCRTPNKGYGLSSMQRESFTLPITLAYIEDITTVAHEIGHNCGAEHSHCYGIDCCANDNGCPTCSPEVPAVGTIMSYCNTIFGGSITMKFDQTAVRGAIRDYMESRTACITPIDLKMDSFTISNTGNATLNVSKIDVPGGNDWLTIYPTGLIEIPEGDSQEVMVIYECAEVSDSTNVTLTLHSDDVLQPETEVVVGLQVDKEPPSAVCTNLQLFLDTASSVSFLPEAIDAGSTDNIGIVSYQISENTFFCDDIGANNVDLTVTDAAGNTDTCSAVVTVMDFVSPNAVCSNISVELGAGGTVEIEPADVDGGSFDNCGIESRTLSKSVFTCDDLGENEIFLTLIDASGNGSTCSVIVTVTDPSDFCTSVIDCDPGFGPNIDNTACIACQPGTFSGGSQGCQPCAAGTIAPNAESESCTQCPPGTAPNAEHTECLPLEGEPDGEGGGEGFFVDCDPGFGPNAQETECIACQPGTYSGGSEACRPCEAGTIAPNAESESCTQCPPGTAPNAEHTECLPLEGEPDGEGGGEGIFVDCDPGFGPNAQETECIACQPGTYSGGSEACRPCEAGTIAPDAESESCTQCPPGTAPNAEHTECLPVEGEPDGEGAGLVCPAGYAPDSSGTVCIICAPGTFSDDGTECKACADGTFNREPGLDYCILCEGGTTPNSEHTACYEGEGAPGGEGEGEGEGGGEGGGLNCGLGTAPDSEGRTCVTCPPGTYSNLGESCKRCEENSVTATSGNIACIICQPGTRANAERTACVPGERHSADTDGNNRLDLPELLRAIQLYNAGVFFCYTGEGESEDGFVLVGSDQSCARHSSDYNPGDFQISLSELLRAIQLYAQQEFGLCPGVSEDGFCASV
ncbi:MAG: hypothetical protein GC168_05885 [Candidatus Hydrogenedens sp.]|nr:hypothetical protein [Candidatus Hydrogenedens sp.]